jgi:hypothetical protein
MQQKQTLSNSHEIPFHGIRERNDIYAGWTTAKCMWNHMKNVFCVMMSVTISAITKCSVLLYPQLFVGGLMSYLRYICLFAYSGLQHIVFYVFHRLVYPMLPVSLDCPFLIAHSKIWEILAMTLWMHLWVISINVWENQRGQSRMDNPEKLAILDTQDTGRWQT